MPYNKKANTEKCKKFREKRTSESRAKLYLKERKKRVHKRRLCIDQYGGKCVCCGEDRFELLAFDHINDDGAEHRREVQQGGENFVKWLIKEGFPDHIQILCHNCNSAKGWYGICPHERERRGIVPYEEEIFSESLGLTRDQWKEIRGRFGKE